MKRNIQGLAALAALGAMEPRSLNFGQHIAATNLAHRVGPGTKANQRAAAKARRVRQHRARA